MAAEATEVVPPRLDEIICAGRNISTVLIRFPGPVNIAVKGRDAKLALILRPTLESGDFVPRIPLTTTLYEDSLNAGIKGISWENAVVNTINRIRSLRKILNEVRYTIEEGRCQVSEEEEKEVGYRIAQLKDQLT